MGVQTALVAGHRVQRIKPQPPCQFSAIQREQSAADSPKIAHHNCVKALIQASTYHRPIILHVSGPQGPSSGSAGQRRGVPRFLTHRTGLAKRSSWLQGPCGARRHWFTYAQAGEAASDGSAPGRQAAAPHNCLRRVLEGWLWLAGITSAARTGLLLACTNEAKEAVNSCFQSSNFRYSS